MQGVEWSDSKRPDRRQRKNVGDGRESLARRKLMNGRVHTREYERLLIIWRVEKSDQHRFVASTIWLRVWFHAGAMSMSSVEKRLFPLHPVRKLPPPRRE